MNELLRIEQLRINFNTFEGTTKVVEGIDIYVKEGEVVGLVGESGCGKTITAKTVLGILPIPPASITGKIILKGHNLLGIPVERARDIRRKNLAFVPQDPTSSLNPLFTIERQMCDLLKWRKESKFGLFSYLIATLKKSSYKRERDEALRFLEKVNISDTQRVLISCPFELSGGMRQRVLIAMALMVEPSLIIFDEPTTALDVSVQDQILDLIEIRVKDERKSAFYITHDLGVARRLCHRIYVMYAGNVVEMADQYTLFKEPRHPYTQALLEAVPKLYGEMSKGIPGRIPSYYDPPEGCRFHPRCSKRKPVCTTAKPKLIKINESRYHIVACHRVAG